MHGTSLKPDALGWDQVTKKSMVGALLLQEGKDQVSGDAAHNQTPVWL